MRKSEIINTRKHFVPAMHSPSCCHWYQVMREGQS
jgi:hypothetical protein